MQEGNVFARYRAQRALAEQAAKTRGVNGEILTGTPLPPELQTQIGQWGRPNITPGKKHAKQELLPRPVRPAGPAPERKINSNPNVVEMGPSAPGTFGEAQAAMAYLVEVQPSFAWMSKSFKSYVVLKTGDAKRLV